MTEAEPPTTFLGSGEMPQLIRDFDWAPTSLGPLCSWAPALKAVVAMIQRSPLPIVTLWGEDGFMIYNDAYSLFAGSRHPSLLGSKVREGWPEVADFNDTVIKEVFRKGRTLSFQDQVLILDRGRGPEKAWLNLDYSQIVDEDGTALGVIAIVVETTDKVAIDRQLQDERIRLRQMYDQSASFMALLEGPEQRFSIVNPAYRKLVGGRDVVNRTLADALPEAIAQGFGTLLDGAFHSGRPYSSHNTPFDIPSPDTGQVERHYVDFIFQPIANLDGKITGIFINGIDVSEGVAAQEALRASEAQFRTFAQAMPNHVWTSTPSGRLDWLNERVSEYSGLSGPELLGIGWAGIVHPDELRGAASDWQSALHSGNPYQTEFRIRRHDDQYRWHLVRALPIRGDDGQILRWIGTNTDIHEQKLLEAASNRDRDRLWSQSQDILLVCGFDGTILSINPSAERLLGWHEDEMVGHSIMDFLHEDDVEDTAAELGKLSFGATTLAFENRYRCKDGGYRLLDWTAVPDGERIHGIGRDITETRRASRDRERIWNLSPVLKFVAKTSGEITAVNPAWTKTLGWSESETVGRHVLSFVAPDSLDGAVARLKQLEQPGTMTTSESLLSTRDGALKRISWKAVSEGDTVYAFGRDISAEFEAEQELRKTQAALLQSQKMEAIGQLTGGIAHDFNNLLQVVGGNLQLLSKDVPPEGRASQRISNAMEGVARGSRLASQLLAFGRQQPLAPKVVNMARLVRGMDDMLRRAIGEAIDLETVTAGGQWNTKIDPGNVENALLNLAINARDAMEGRGKLTIETGNAYLDNQYVREHPDVAPGQYVVLSVTDTGSGMSPETVSKAFEPFFSTKPDGKGTGLGLSMVYGFVKQSGGHAKIYSELGEGTTVRLYFPRITQGEDEVVIRQSGQIKGGKETILVAEDDSAVRETVVEMLGDLGYRVLQAPDAQSALAIVASGIPIDLLFTDVVMPGPMKATEMAKKAVQRLPGLKVLFTSGYTENSIVHGGRLDEGVELLSKPYPREALAWKIRDMLGSTPPAVAPTSPDLMGDPAPAAPPTPKATVLLVEDDVLIRMATAGMLEDAGLSVLEAGSGGVALTTLEQQQIDLLIVDMGLPDMTGAELAKRALSLRRDLPIVFATGQAKIEGIALGERMRFLPKPYDQERLEEVINALLGPDALSP